jgi:hypothetical protein
MVERTRFQLQGGPKMGPWARGFYGLVAKMLEKGLNPSIPLLVVSICLALKRVAVVCLIRITVSIGSRSQPEMVESQLCHPVYSPVAFQHQEEPTESQRKEGSLAKEVSSRLKPGTCRVSLGIEARCSKSKNAHPLPEYSNHSRSNKKDLQHNHQPILLHRGTGISLIKFF